MPRLVLSQLLLLFFHIVCGQQQYLFNRYTTNDGLASNKVYCTVQDKMGYLWIGTANGLQRFDGKRFLTIPLTGVRPLSTSIQSLTLDTNGKIIVLAGPNLYTGSEAGIIDPQTLSFHNINIATPKNSPKGTYQLFKDNAGHIFLTSPLLGIYELDRTSNLFSESAINKKLPRNWGVNYLFEDRRNGNYWLTSDSGLALYDKATKEIYTHQYNPKHIGVLKESINEPDNLQIDDEGKLWFTNVTNDNGLNILCFDEKQGKFLKQPVVNSELPDTKMLINGLVFTRNKQMWAFGFHCLLKYDSSTNSLYQYRAVQTENNKVKFTRAISFYEDAQGLLWLGTASDGLYFFNPNIQGLTRHISTGITDNNIYDIANSGNGELWAGTAGQGIYIIDTTLNFKAGSDLKHIDLKNAWVTNLIKPSHTSVIYATTVQGEIIAIDPSTKKINQWVKPKLAAGSFIRGIAEDRSGNIWFSCGNKTLLRLPFGKPVSESNLEYVCKLPAVPYRLFVDNKNNLFIATSGEGLYVMDLMQHKVIVHYTQNEEKSNSLSSNLVTDVLQLNDSLYYIACDGLDLLNSSTGSIRHIVFPDGKPARAFRMELANDGTLWISNAQAMFCYNYKSNTFSKYGTESGFSQTEYLITSLVTEKGKLFFAGNDVITGFYPNQVKSSGSVYPVALTEVRLFDRILPATYLDSSGKISFAYNRNSLSFYFSTLSFLPNQDITYYYRLKGASNDWIKADASQSVTYSLIPPGSYRFEVYSDNGKGSKSAVTSFSFTIRPPFWLTWWFITLCALLTASVIYFIYHQRIQRLIAIQKVRQRVASDLHDDMGSTLSSISILSAIAEEKLATDNNTRQYITKIKDNSTSMMEAMNYIVWSINPNNDSMQKVLARMRSFATEVLESKGIALSFTADKQLERLQLDMERKRDLFLIYKEAINNAAKYSEGDQVTITMSLHHHQLQLAIQDNGRGFTTGEIRGGGNGLENMQKRAASLKGSLDIQSTPGKGTKVTLTLPVK